MFVHTFGAYYGLAIARVLFRKDVQASEKEGSVYHADLFSMIGIRQIDIEYNTVNYKYYKTTSCDSDEI